MGSETLASLVGSYAVVTLAEMGDKTQLATVALGARFASTLDVTAGTTLGMLSSDGLAVFAGTRLVSRAPMRLVRRVAAALFFALGSLGVAKALGLV